MPRKGSVTAFNVPEVFPRILFFTVIKSPLIKYGLFIEPGEADDEYLTFFLNRLPSLLYLIKKIFPERGFLGPDKFITSDNVPSNGIRKFPGFSIRPEILTFINLGDSPEIID